MHRILAFVATPLWLAAAELTIDHVTAAGRDLQRMQANLARVGLACEYGGPHGDGTTEMALVGFPDGSYLELIAPRRDAAARAVAAHAWARPMLGEAGPCAWAVRVKDMAAEVGRLQRAGIAVSAPARSGRNRPDGQRLEWETAQVGAEPLGSFFPFLIRDFSPRPQRAYPSGKPTTKDFGGVTRVAIAVRDLKASVKRYREAYDLPAPIFQVDAGFGARLALLGGTPIVLAAPLTADSWLHGRIEQLGEGPCAFVLGQRRGRYKAALKTRWFGADISWFDNDQLGWALGFE